MLCRLSQAEFSYYPLGHAPTKSLQTPKAMSQTLQDRLFAELDAQVLIDPHTHINPHAPASETLLDILGYHYYTELAPLGGHVTGSH